MITIKKSEAVDQSWNYPLRQFENEATIFQSTYWAEYLKKRGEKPFFILAQDEHDREAGLLLYSKGKLKNLPLVGSLSAYYHWLYGPLILEKEKEALVFNVMLNFLESEARREKIYCIANAFPPIFRDNEGYFNHFGFTGRPVGTFVVDLRKPENLLWSSIKKEARHCVRKALTNNVIVVDVSDEEGLLEYYKLYRDFRKKSKLQAMPFSNFQAMWDIFFKRKFLKIFTAKLNGKPMAGIMALVYNGVIYELSVAESEFGRESKLYPNDLLKWHVIKWGSENKCNFFNLAGVELESTSTRAAGIFRYKAKWGGELVKFHVYTRIYSRFRRGISRLSKKLGLR